MTTKVQTAGLNVYSRLKLASGRRGGGEGSAFLCEFKTGFPRFSQMSGISICAFYFLSSHPDPKSITLGIFQVLYSRRENCLGRKKKKLTFFPRQLEGTLEM